MRAGEALGVRDAVGFGDDLKARLVVDQPTQTVADDEVMIGDDDGERVAVGRLARRGLRFGGREHLGLRSVESVIAVVDDDLGHARGPGVAYGRALGGSRAVVLG